MNMRITRLGRIAAAVALVAGFASTTASANNLAYAIGTANWTFTGTAQVLVPNTTTATFNKAANQRLIVTFSAECAAIGPTSSWLDVDIVLIKASTGAVVATLSPTIGNGDAFCSSSVPNAYVWNTQSVQGLVPFNLPAGAYKAAVRARLNGATTGWLGERMLTVAN